MKTAIVAAASMLILASCSSPQMLASSATANLAAGATTAVAAPSTVKRLADLCELVQPLAIGAEASGNQSLQTVGQFGVAYCGALLAGVVPATTDANTESWLADILAQLRG